VRACQLRAAEPNLRAAQTPPTAALILPSNGQRIEGKVAGADTMSVRHDRSAQSRPSRSSCGGIATVYNSLGFLMIGAALFWAWFAISPALGRSDTRTSGYTLEELLTKFWVDFALIGGVALLGTLFLMLGRRKRLGAVQANR
jgi:hypothetical protein